MVCLNLKVPCKRTFSLFKFLSTAVAPTPQPSTIKNTTHARHTHTHHHTNNHTHTPKTRTHKKKKQRTELCFLFFAIVLTKTFVVKAIKYRPAQPQTSLRMMQHDHGPDNQGVGGGPVGWLARPRVKKGRAATNLTPPGKGCVASDHMINTPVQTQRGRGRTGNKIGRAVTLSLVKSDIDILTLEQTKSPRAHATRDLVTRLKSEQASHAELTFNTTQTTMPTDRLLTCLSIPDHTPLSYPRTDS